MFVDNMSFGQIRLAVFGAVERVFGQDGSPLEHLSRTLMVLHFSENKHPDRQPEHHRHVWIIFRTVVRRCGGGQHWYVA